MDQIPIKKANEISHGRLMAFKVCPGAAQMSLKSWFIRCGNMISFLAYRKDL